MKTKKYFISIILILSLVATSSVAFAGSDKAQSGVPDGQQSAKALASSLNKITITLESKSYDKSSASSMPWGSSLTFKANIYRDDGKLATDNSADADWSVTDISGNATQVWIKSWRGDDGVARIKMFAPYGMTGNLVLKAVSKTNNALSATQNISVTDGSTVTGTRYFRSIHEEDVPETETWNKEEGTYTINYPPFPMPFAIFLL